jgi:hypothetical protein
MVGRRAAVLLATAVLATGCRLDVVTEAAVDPSGGGELLVAVRIDGATLRRLDALGVDPALDVAAALDPGSGWRPSRGIDGDGGLVLGHRRTFADGAELAALLAGLSAGLAPDDPGLRFDLDVTTVRGGVTLVGTAGLSPPGTTGLLRDGVPVGPAGETLAELTARAVRPVLRVSVPGALVSHDGDRSTGRTVEWDLPVGGTRPIGLVSEPVPAWRRMGWPLAAAVTTVAVMGVTAVVRRRRSDPGEGGVGSEDLSPAG